MKLSIALTAVALLAGCDSQSAGTETRFPGTLVQNALGVETLAAPDMVVAGRPFTVAVVTAGGGCVRQGDVEVAKVDVRPFDVFVDPGPGGACTRDLIYFEHTATVTFRTPRTATVRAIGSDASSFAPQSGLVPVVVERRVVVVAR